MSTLVELMENLQLPEGFSESCLEGVRFFRTLQHIPRHPLFYAPGLVILAQGSKRAFIGESSFTYDANNYVVSSVLMPFECETFASPEEPMLGIYIDIDVIVLNELIVQIHEGDGQTVPVERAMPLGIGAAPLDDAMLNAVTRLVTCLQSVTSAQILGPGILREIVFCALMGSQAPMLYALAKHNGNVSKIAKALELIHQNYAKTLGVNELAGEVNMSSSAFHRAFKEITADSPVQYLKKVRLNRARDLLIAEGEKAYVAAERVGYESSTQFSREFKRYYGYTPGEVKRQVQGSIL